MFHFFVININIALYKYVMSLDSDIVFEYKTTHVGWTKWLEK
jgi:hypothetical protein